MSVLKLSSLQTRRQLKDRVTQQALRDAAFVTGVVTLACRPGRGEAHIIDGGIDGWETTEGWVEDNQ